MAGKSKGAKSKPKAAGTKKTESPGTGCHACNFSGEVCRECREPATSCECKTFTPEKCASCNSEAGQQPEAKPEELEPVAEPVKDMAADADGQTEIIGPPSPSQEQIAGALEDYAAKVFEEGAAAAVESGEMLSGDGADDAKQPGPETSLAIPGPVQPRPEPPTVSSGRDAELESLVEQSVKRRIERLKNGNRRRHHTKQLSVRVLTGIVKAGEAAAQGGADGFFGRWCRNDLMAWEALMDAAEWAQEELNAREFRRLKRESAKAQQENTTAATS